VLITSNRQSVENLDPSVLVDVFAAGEAVAFLVDRTRLADTEGVAELGTCGWRWRRPRPLSPGSP
jgi:hypothetical protein